MNNLRKVKLLPDIFNSESGYYPEIQDSGYFHKWTTMTIIKRTPVGDMFLAKEVEVDAGLIELEDGQVIKVHFNRIKFIK